MRTLSLAAAFTLIAATASAADATAPVREVMDMTAKNWATTDSDWVYVFADEPLQRLFSQRFQAAYHEAAKTPAYETDDGSPGDPFGYDVVTASQDGCPLEEMAIDGGAEEVAVRDVKVTFKLWRCLDQAELRESVNEVHFDVIEESGRYVIDDIHRVGIEEQDSVLAEMKELAGSTQ
jgi:hypothetical protein